ncbi:hypothetical protein BKA67DRAFT_538327 [Truncatella angustata]|uniref:Uncharacterized protein n=1 Tax=Truncatella angustata TaxID=152316 RepID=A0A9P8ZSZ8_9PEZI|nr:uncharacterized protein BKA67DRAFT_538327 [Truncatella angustata]KAH6648277.1 hypothetical protein BKA67DRAFT_538327 [Truncatella angustata]
MYGTCAKKQLVDERHAGHKPKSPDFVQSTGMPLTYATVFESLLDRLGIQKVERATVVFLSSPKAAAWAVSIASQVTRHSPKLPVAITTASRKEASDVSKKMGVTHAINHRHDIVKQIEDLSLS